MQALRGAITHRLLRMGLLFPILAVGGLLWWTREQACATTVDHILTRYLTARLGLNLRGTMVVVNAANPYPVPSTMKRVVRTRSGACFAVVTEPATLRGLVTVDDGTLVRAYEPHYHMVKIQRSRVAAARAFGVNRRARVLRANYRVDVLGLALLSGRRCYRLRFTPRYRGSHEVQIWVDRATGAELGREEKDIRGGTTALTLFTSVEFPRRIARSEITGTFPRRARRVDISRSAIFTDVGKLSGVAGFQVCVPLTMPSGYVFEDCALVSINGMRTAVLRYTDGMNVISVCQTPVHSPGAGDRGAVVRLSQGEAMLQKLLPNNQIAIMGHVEPPTLAAVASSLDVARERRFGAQAQRLYGASPASIRALRAKGITLETIAAMMEARRRTGRNLAGLAQMHQAGWTWRDIARRFGISEACIIARLNMLR